MQIIIVCGNDDCRQEYKVDTNDRFWECPHCGRKRESDHYPFLTAKLMQARIDGDGADWETIHTEALEKASVKVQENDNRIARLEYDAGVAIEGEVLASEHLADLKDLKEEDEASDKAWRSRAEEFMKKARAIIIEQEDRIKMLEQELQKKKKASAKKGKGPVRKSKKELEEEDSIKK